MAIDGRGGHRSPRRPCLHPLDDRTAAPKKDRHRTSWLSSDLPQRFAPLRSAPKRMPRAFLGRTIRGVCALRSQSKRHGKRNWTSAIWQLLITFPRNWMCRRVSANAAISQHVERRLQLPRSRTVYYGVPDLRGEAISPLPASSAPVCFGFVGRLVEEKGLTVLLDAASRIRKRGFDFRLKFIGDGPERARLEALVLQNGLRSQVIFTGSLNGEALPQSHSRRRRGHRALDNGRDRRPGGHRTDDARAAGHRFRYRWIRRGGGRNGA